jgi:hypothetical protein
VRLVYAEDAAILRNQCVIDDVTLLKWDSFTIATCSDTGVVWCSNRAAGS